MEEFQLVAKTSTLVSYAGNSNVKITNRVNMLHTGVLFKLS